MIEKGQKSVLYATVLVCPPHFFSIIFYSVGVTGSHYLGESLVPMTSVRIAQARYTVDCKIRGYTVVCVLLYNHL